MEYNHLQLVPINILRNRLVLLHHFSDLFCPCIPMFDLEQTQEYELGGGGVSGGGVGGPDALRGVLVSSAKETAFRKVVQATMIRDRQHGPVIEINRIQVCAAITRIMFHASVTVCEICYLQFVEVKF